MKRVARWALAACLVAAPAYAQVGGELPGVLLGLEKAPPFSADVVITSRALAQPTAYHVLYAGNRVRLETGGQEGQVIIMRLVQGTALISQGADQWMQVSLADMGGSGLEPGAFHHSVRKTGQATINGMVCDVYQTAGDDGTRSTNYVYQNVPIRSIVQGPTGTTTVSYSHVQLGGVSESAFELPVNAQVMSMDSILNQLKGAGGVHGLGN